MSICHLGALLCPASVAVIGATDRSASVGATLWRNLRAGGFAGPRHAVNPNRSSLDGEPVFATIQSLPAAPELAIVRTPAHAVADGIAQFGAKGAQAAVVLTAVLSDAQKKALLQNGRPHLGRHHARPHLLFCTAI